MCKSTEPPRLAARLAVLLATGLGLGLVPSMPAVPADGTSSGSAVTVPGDEKALLERARAYWDARGRRLSSVMAFYAPPDKGGPTRPKDVSEFGNVTYKEWKVESAQVEGDAGTVEIRVRIHVALPTPVALGDDVWTRTIHERWIKVDGTWYKQPIPLGYSAASEASAAPAAGRTGGASAVDSAADGKGARP